jgi:deoxyribodipyrimidine photo-lyase
VTIAVWFRNDLRVDDHPPLLEAASSRRLLAVAVLDPRHWAPGPLGFPKMGARRARFTLESLSDLRRALRARGSELVVRHGLPEEVLPPLFRSAGVETLLTHDEPFSEEQDALEAVHARSLALGLRLRTRALWGAGTLYDLDDLPYPLEDLPEVFTRFRKDVEKHARIPRALDAPNTLPPPPDGVDAGTVPTLADLGFDAPDDDPRAVLAFEGGATAGRARVAHYFFEADALRRYKETRNGLIGPNYSSKLSPWLALGCLSARRVAAEVRRYEGERIANESTYWLIFELLWRDYFRFLAAAEGDRIFRRGGIKRRSLSWSRDRPVFDRWREGRTGLPFVDANMRELAATGFMSNRGRQNVASFLARTLRIDWRWGARHFESELLDHDPASNWGNWQYASGVGNDPRDRTFNVLGQAERYDPDGAFVRRWCPELRELPRSAVHRPFEADRDTLRRAGVELGVTYPNPCFDPRRAFEKPKPGPRQGRRRR